MPLGGDKEREKHGRECNERIPSTGRLFGCYSLQKRKEERARGPTSKTGSDTRPQNDYIPLAIVVMAIAYNAINALLFEGDLLKAGKIAFIEATAAIGIHSGVKNSFQKGDVEQ
ncbi:hypothetical protein [Brevibacillus laterosporus]|uniref:hypothetical protein n=1 Tax=Brevibacillus laterosporus TaxID=1465 RepID=UPI0019697D13|nr:hypothetical protein [Brevibacillus laterosporus]